VAAGDGAGVALPQPRGAASVVPAASPGPEPAAPRALGPRPTSAETLAPGPIAFQDDMAHVADVLELQADPRSLDYVAQFLAGVARSASDAPLEQAARALAARRANGGAAASEIAVLAGMVQDRLNQRIAI